MAAAAEAVAHGHGRLLLPFLLLVLAGAYDDSGEPAISRRSFPDGFIFGTTSSAYQYEGGAMKGGKGASIWDNFTHQYPDKIIDKSNGDVAVDSYHLYKEDVRLMKAMGVDAYMFSISWTRILPNGSLSGGVSREGVTYYNNLINELLLKGVQPFATIFHWDSPQGLEDKYEGFLSPNIINDYKDYAEVCFKEFGDRVKHWITISEPWAFCSFGYASGLFAPGRCSPWEKGKCSIGNSSKEPYIACHHQLLAHAEIVRLYKEKYQVVQKGKIGLSLNTHWFIPLSHSMSDYDAARRAMDFMFGWFMDPLIRGDYPKSMRELAGNRLPWFTKEQSKLVKGAFDFIGINYYDVYYVDNLLPSSDLNCSFNTDSRANATIAEELPVKARGFHELLLYVKEKYDNPTIYITENGVDELNNNSLPLEEALQDDNRIEHYRLHLLALLSAMKDGANVRGYFAWSLLDNFEWVRGYTARYGLNFVDFSDGKKRYPKSSARWFERFLRQPCHGDRLFSMVEDKTPMSFALCYPSKLYPYTTM